MENRAILFDRTLSKFLLVGVINMLVGAALMFALYNVFGVNYWLSSIAGSALSFFLNKYFTFALKEWSPFMIFVFAANIGFCYLAAYGIAKPVMQWLLRDRAQALRENAALFAGMCLFTGLNYLGQRLVVFTAPR